MTPTDRHRPIVPRCSFLLCGRPASLAETRRWHRSVERLLAFSRPLIVPIFVALGFLAAFAGNQLGARPALLPAAAFFALVGGWCNLNFVRCREAHCIVIGVGYSVLALAAIVAFVLDRHWAGPLWLASVIVLGAGVVFEAAWRAWRGGNAVRRRGSLEQL